MWKIATAWIFFFTVQILECVQWTIMNPPIIFGQTAILICESSNATEQSCTTWTGGPDYSTLSFDGAPSNPDKYKEMIARKPPRFMLNILDFSENDVNWNYSCSIGFDEDKHPLSLKPNEFEFHPTSANIAVAAYLCRGNLFVSLSLSKVYPKPICKIMFKGINYRKYATENVSKSGKLFSFEILLDYEIDKGLCKGQLEISCTVGSYDVSLYTGYFNTCSGCSETEKQDIVPIIVIVGISVFVLILVVTVIVRLYGPKNINSMCCNFNNTAPGNNVGVEGENNKLMCQGSYDSDNVKQRSVCTSV